MKRSARIKLDVVVTIDDEGLEAPKVCETLTDLNDKTTAVVDLLAPGWAIDPVTPPKLKVTLTRNSMYDINREKYRRNNAAIAQAPAQAVEDQPLA